MKKKSLKKGQLGYLSKTKRPWEPVVCKDIRCVHRSTKSRTCVACGKEIAKGESYYSYKPIFEDRKARCIDCKPTIYNDYEPYDG